jgi:hypothetical protein
LHVSFVFVMSVKVKLDAKAYVPRAIILKGSDDISITAACGEIALSKNATIDRVFVGSIAINTLGQISTAVACCIAKVPVSRTANGLELHLVGSNRSSGAVIPTRWLVASRQPVDSKIHRLHGSSNLF